MMSTSLSDLSLEMSGLRRRYQAGSLKPCALVEEILARTQDDKHHIWISLLSRDAMLAYALALEGKDIDSLPLYGIPFAIKDNIDLAGVETTAACPEYAYVPRQNATVVQRLIDAGAIPVGKANLDQFATGLNGTRSPYGACRNAFNPDYISGGSSAGSAVAVAKGLVSFSLGTDTAGSGRVPAAFNNIVGLKPTCGWISTHGVIPACRSLDTVSIFALTAADAETVVSVAGGYDPQDPYSRVASPHGFDFGRAQAFRFGVPRVDQLSFFGNKATPRLFEQAIERLKNMGGLPVIVDFEPFLETARLLYEGAWVAERYAAIKDFFDTHPDAIHPAVRQIIGGGATYTAVDTFKGMYRLKALQSKTNAVWNDIDCLVTPTAGTIYTVADMQDDPIRLNANLGYYTNFMNFLEYAAVAVPAGFQPDGLPFGVTLAAPANQDGPLLHLAAKMHQAADVTLGATSAPIPGGEGGKGPLPSGQVRVAVCGAHLAGLPLNRQLTDRGARLVAETTSSSDYKLYALPGGPPFRPGMVRVEKGESGNAIQVEVWEMPATQFGSFVAGIPAPLGIGTLTLSSGEQVQGFVCENYAVAGATDITHFGGWRAYLRSL